MDGIRKYYNPSIKMPPQMRPVEKDSRVYAGHVFWPHINHSNIAYYPPFVPQKEVKLHLEPDHNIIFQRSPLYYYAPGHSNLDVDLPSQ